MNQQDQINWLKQEIRNLEKSIEWYKSTYENRKLAGIIKDRLIKSNGKRNQRDKGGLEKRIHRVILQNPATIRQIAAAPTVSIIMLSYNRVDDTERAIRNIYKHTTIPFELIVLDNNSTDDVRERLKAVVKKREGMKLILETSNLGCANGRIKAARHARHDYLLFLDNDILTAPFYLENLYARLLNDPQAAGVCCKVVFPNGKIQFNGGKMVVDDQYAVYSLHDEGLDFDDPASQVLRDCEWIPGGATLWKREIFEKFRIDENMKGSFEDNEISLRMIKAGYKLLNSPASIVIHDHYDFKEEEFKQREARYFAERNNHSRLKEALLHFFNKHQMIFSFAWKNNPWDMIWNLNSREEILRFIAENNPPK